MTFAASVCHPCSSSSPPVSTVWHCVQCSTFAHLHSWSAGIVLTEEQVVVRDWTCEDALAGHLATGIPLGRRAPTVLLAALWEATGRTRRELAREASIQPVNDDKEPPRPTQ